MALVKCKECDKEISSSVKICPHCGKKRSQEVSAAIVVLALVGVGWFLYNKFSDATSTVSDSVAQTSAATANRPIYKTSAEALFAEYEDNEVATDQKIGNAIVEVSGIIDSIDKDIGEHAVTSLTDCE